MLYSCTHIYLFLAFPSAHREGTRTHSVHMLPHLVSIYHCVQHGCWWLNHKGNDPSFFFKLARNLPSCPGRTLWGIAIIGGYFHPQCSGEAHTGSRMFKSPQGCLKTFLYLDTENVGFCALLCSSWEACRPSALSPPEFPHINPSLGQVFSISKLLSRAQKHFVSYLFPDPCIGMVQRSSFSSEARDSAHPLTKSSSRVLCFRLVLSPGDQWARSLSYSFVVFFWSWGSVCFWLNMEVMREHTDIWWRIMQG